MVLSQCRSKSQLPAAMLLKFRYVTLASPPLIGLIALAAATIVANLFLYYYAMKRAPMWAVRVLALVAIPTAVAGDYFVLGAPITMNAVQGMLLVIIGALVIIQAGRGRATAEQPC